jgi:hypothetical protein
MSCAISAQASKKSDRQRTLTASPPPSPDLGQQSHTEKQLSRPSEALCCKFGGRSVAACSVRCSSVVRKMEESSLRGLLNETILMMQAAKHRLLHNGVTGWQLVPMVADPLAIALEKDSVGGPRRGCRCSGVGGCRLWPAKPTSAQRSPNCECARVVRTPRSRSRSQPSNNA